MEKRGAKTRHEHRTKPQLVAEMVHKIAAWQPPYKLHVVADVAYLGQQLVKDRADNVELIGFQRPAGGPFAIPASPQAPPPKPAGSLDTTPAIFTKRSRRLSNRN
jgi:hypothetical protein